MKKAKNKKSKRRPPVAGSAGAPRPPSATTEEELFERIQGVLEECSEAEAAGEAFKTKKVALLLKQLGAPVAHRFAACPDNDVDNDLFETLAKELEQQKDITSAVNEPFGGYVPLVLAVACGNWYAFDALLQVDAHVDGSRSPRKRMEDLTTYMAVQFRRPRFLRALIDAGVTFPEPNNIMHLALLRLDGTHPGTNLSEEVLDALIDHRVGLNALNSDGMSTAYAALYLQTRRYRNVDRTPGDVELRRNALVRTFAKIINAGADLSVSIKGDLQSLMELACQNHVDPRCLNLLLLQSSCDPHARSGHKGMNALEASVQLPNLAALAQIVARRRVNLNIRFMEGQRLPDLIRTQRDHDAAKMMLTIFCYPGFHFLKNDYEFSQELMLNCEQAFYNFELKKQKDFVPPQVESGLIVYRALQSGNIGRLQQELKTHDVRSKSQSGETVLHWAVMFNNLEAVEWLLTKAVDVNEANGNGQTALHLAAKKDNSLEIMDALLRAGANINAQDFSGLTPLFMSIIGDRLENMEFLYKEMGADISLCDSNYGASPFHYAALEDKRHVIESILQHNKDVISLPSRSGASALHYAAKSNACPTAKILLMYRAPVDHVCKMRGNAPLHVAAACSSIQSALCLLQGGCNVNARNNIQETPLHLASMTKNIDMVVLLLKFGANINATDMHGQTPLFCAINLECFEVAKTLIDQGAKVQITESYNKEAPLHIAAMLKDKDIVKKLLAAGCNIEAKDSLGFTPLLRAVYADNGKVAKYLISKGANIKARGQLGGQEVDLIDIMEKHMKLQALSSLTKKCPQRGTYSYVPPLDRLLEAKEEGYRWSSKLGTIMSCRDGLIRQGMPVGDNMKNILIAMRDSPDVAKHVAALF